MTAEKLLLTVPMRRLPMKLIFTFIFLCITSILHAQYFFNDGSKWGLKDSTGKVIVPCRYGYVNGFKDRPVARVSTNNKWGAITQSGREVIPQQYDELFFYDEVNLFRAKQNKKWGLIDITGKEVIPVMYDFCFPENDGYVLVKLNSKYGILDKTGKTVIPIKYDKAEYFEHSPYVLVTENKQYSLLDKKGNLFKTLKYDSIGMVYRNIACVQLNEKWGIIDSVGNEIVTPNYQEVTYYDGGITAAKQNGKWGFLNKTGKSITSFKYERVKGFYNGMAAVSDNGSRFGYIDNTGREVVTQIYSDGFGMDFSNGIAQVEIASTGRKCFIDKSGKEVLKESESSVGKTVKPKETENFQNATRYYESKSYDEAFKKFKQEANGGDVASMKYLAIMYFNGLGISKDENNALIWAKKAVEYGDAGAMQLLGEFYANSSQKDITKSIEWNTKAAALGNIYSMNNLGNLYAAGEGVEKSFDKAISWFYKAAELGSAAARNSLGQIYLNGYAGKVDYDKAFEYFYKSYKVNNTTSGRTNLGLMYVNGWGTKKQIDDAVRLFIEARDAGDADGAYYMGMLYMTNQIQCNTSFENNCIAALSEFSSAIKQGHADAAYNAGLILANGWGIAKNDVKAIELFKYAASQGHPGAEDWLKQHK